MKKGDLIVVYKIYVGNIPTEEIPSYVNDIAKRFKEENNAIVQYFIPTTVEPEHPIEVINTDNCNNK